jgi:methionyl-tRNA formyltransferase
VACGTGAVEITLAQREGKRAMAAGDILRGAGLPAMLG